MKKLFSTINKVVSTVVVFAALLAVIGGAYIITHKESMNVLYVKTGSMEPTLSVGSLIVTFKQPNYQLGDIVTYRQNGNFVTHRFVGVDSQGFLTKGDANNTIDSNAISKQEIIGKTIFTLPAVGISVDYLRTPLGFSLLIVLPGLLVVLQEIFAIGKELEKMKREIHEPGSGKTDFGQLAPALCLLVVAGLITAGNSHALFTDMADSDNNVFAARQTFAADYLVINEIYFAVDSTHGNDCDESTNGNNSAGNSGNNQNGSISNTGNGSTNTISLENNSQTNIETNNTAVVTNETDIGASTGSNSANNNTGNGSTSSGDIAIGINNSTTVNNGRNSGSRANANCDEWIELYNPTATDINVKNWKIVDGSGNSLKINTNKTIKAGGYAVLTKSSRTLNRFWNLPSGATEIRLGQWFDDGLGNSGDRVGLYAPDNSTIDLISWGSDATTPHFTGTTPIGNSIQRLLPGLDTNNSSDFSNLASPTPGQ